MKGLCSEGLGSTWERATASLTQKHTPNLQPIIYFKESKASLQPGVGIGEAQRGVVK